MNTSTAHGPSGRPASERRRTKRARAPSGLRLRFAGQLDAAKVDDISTHGVSCVTSHAIPLLTQVEVVLLIPTDGASREVVCSGAVVRSTRRTGAAGGDRGQHGTEATGAQADVHETAIFFTQIDEADRNVLDEYVSSLHRADKVA